MSQEPERLPDLHAESVVRRTLDLFDHQDEQRHLPRFELQAELLLNGREQAGMAAGKIAEIQSRSDTQMPSFNERSGRA